MGRRTESARAVSKAYGLAERDLWSQWERATAFDHSGTRGTSREDGVREFLRNKLPGRYRVVEGEVVDRFDRRSTQLDVIVYDQMKDGPIETDNGRELVPAEAVLGVVEVKSVLSEGEWKTCFKAAKKLRDLRPFGHRFIGRRTGGTSAADNRCRLFYSIMSFETNLSSTDWLSKEWARAKGAASSQASSLDTIDRCLVLSEGLIAPSRSIGHEFSDRSKALQMWFLQILNFLNRENGRRRAFDLQDYCPKVSRGWQPLK